MERNANLYFWVGDGKNNEKCEAKNIKEREKKQSEIK